MRVGVFIIVCSILAGCVAKSSCPVSTTPPLVPAAPPAASLAFSPTNMASLALWRDDLAPAAFVGYDDVTVTYYYLRLDDRQMDFFDPFGNYLNRHAVTERIGMSVR